MTLATRYQLKTLGQTVLRIGASAAFFVHGASKVLGWFGGFGPQHASVPLGTELGIGGIIEMVGSIFVALGLFTRPAALIMAGEMMVAYIKVHTLNAHDARWWVNGGELALVYAAIWFFFACAGAGLISVDALRRREVADPMAVPKFRERYTVVTPV